MAEFFPNLILGHLVGDYLFQNKWMALSKGNSSWRCFVHCLVYTVTVVSFTWCSLKADWRWILLVFLAHFVVDRWSLADKWLDLIGGRSLCDFKQKGHLEVPRNPDFTSRGDNEWKNYWCLRGGFTALVYAVADNTMHLVLMYYGGLLIWRMQ